MPVVHFLNVKEGDCSIIEHGSGHVSVIDVCNARKPDDSISAKLEKLAMKAAGSGNLNQKGYPVNPIEYLKEHGIDSIFRFIATHPDMDHLDGIKDLFEYFSPFNFYDINNNKEIGFDVGSPYREEDWKFYKNLRDKNPKTNPQRLTLFSGDSGIHRTKDWKGNPPGDAFYILAPTPEMVKEANESDDYNDCSYVVLYHGAGGKVLFSGDAHDKTWEHLVLNHKNSIKDIDLLIAPHHGRKSDRDYSFLDVVKPKMTFFGNARAEHLAYSAWSYRKLPYITNNQANCMIVDAGDSSMPLFITNETFARQKNSFTWYSDIYKGWFLQNIK
jgi:competence protein ComEC